MAGWYDALRATVYVRGDLTADERRSTLAHELVHAQLGDRRQASLWADMRQEQRARRIAARECIPIHALAVALAFSATENEAAQRLRVDVEMLRDRIDDLTIDEVDYIDRYVERS